MIVKPVHERWIDKTQPKVDVDIVIEAAVWSYRYH